MTEPFDPDNYYVFKTKNGEEKFNIDALDYSVDQSAFEVCLAIDIATKTIGKRPSKDDFLAICELISLVRDHENEVEPGPIPPLSTLHVWFDEEDTEGRFRDLCNNNEVAFRYLCHSRGVGSVHHHEGDCCDLKPPSKRARKVDGKLYGGGLEA